MEALPGLLVVWNGMEAGDEGEFNAWYEEEHLAERLSVPGFRTAARYRNLEGACRYAALYETDSVEVLSSEAYLARLANPTPRTRAIMPRFREVSRAACSVRFDTRPGTLPAPFLAVVTLRPGAMPACWPPAFEPELRWRIAEPDPLVTGGTTPEQALRPVPDRLPPTLVIVEADDAAMLSSAAAWIGSAAEGVQRFALISSRQAV